jgi:Flp pilus assembly protein TadG
MKNTICRQARKPGQRGVAAVEMAVLLPVLLLFLAATLFLTRYFWHYTVAQKAAHDAARYLATVSQKEMKTTGAGGTGAPAVQIAWAIARKELEELKPGPDAPFVSVECRPNPCSGFVVPSKVRVFVQMEVVDELFSPFTDFFLGEQHGVLLTADVTMRYVGS